MLLFKQGFNYTDPLNIVFLCGNKYLPETGKDKRDILKNYLLNSTINCQPIILEENFIFAKNSKKLLAYEDVFLNNLSQVEKLTSLYANRIIIIHETISTAAEIGLLASDNSLKSKICILFPDGFSIEENKISSFIQLAFFNNNDARTYQPKRIKYYPDIEIHRDSADKSDYYTFFHENKIGNVLGEQILSFVKNANDKRISIIKVPFHKPHLDRGIISYYVSERDKEIYADLYVDALKIQLFSFFAVDRFKYEVRKEKAIKDHVTFIENEYKKVLLDSICNIEGLDSKNYKFNVNILDPCDCNLRQAIGYYLYTLQGIGFIGLEQVSSDDYVNRKTIIKQSLEKQLTPFKKYIYEKTTTEFGGIS